VGYEALARWTTKDRVIPANEFIGAAEESGAISELGGIVIAEAIAEIPGLAPGQVMTINASASQLHDPEFASRIQRQLRNCGADPAQLAVEITEHSIVNLDTEAHAGIKLLSDAGVGLFVDDFGTGFSSMTMLLDFPVTGIKLDGAFARRVHGDPSGTASRLVTGLAEIAHRLGLTAIAEGIETSEEHRLLAQHGWNAGQGWLYGKAQQIPAPTAVSAMRPEAALADNAVDVR